MPRTLFEPVVVSPDRNRRPIGTLAVSIVLHAAALAAIASLQFTAALDPPDVAPRLLAYVPPPPSPPALPPAQRPTPRAATQSVARDVAPTVAPDSVRPEPRELPASAARVPSTTFSVGPPDGPVRGAGQVVVLLADPPAPTTPLRLGGAIRAPARIVHVPPEYPAFARSARVEGDVVLEATIDASGAVTNIVVRRSVPTLDRAAIDAVSRWRYTPTRLNGVAVPIVMEVTVSFRIKGEPILQW
jgi:protein TonB